MTAESHREPGYLRMERTAGDVLRLLESSVREQTCWGEFFFSPSQSEFPYSPHMFMPSLTWELIKVGSDLYLLLVFQSPLIKQK